MCYLNHADPTLPRTSVQITLAAAAIRSLGEKIVGGFNWPGVTTYNNKIPLQSVSPPETVFICTRTAAGLFPLNFNGGKSKRAVLQLIGYDVFVWDFFIGRREGQ